MITASALQLHPEVLVFIDKDASGELTMVEYYQWIQHNKPGAPGAR